MKYSSTEAGVPHSETEQAVILIGDEERDVIQLAAWHRRNYLETQALNIAASCRHMSQGIDNGN